MEKKVTYFKVSNSEDENIFLIRSTKKQAEDLKADLAAFGVIANVEKESKVITL